MKQILIKKTESKNIVEGAEEYATRMHAGQKRQYIAAAWLHDVVEDTSATIGNIKNNFGGAMANIVAILTKGSNEEEYAKRFAKCKKEIMSSYSPDRPEIVYCETCYQQEVY